MTLESAAVFLALLSAGQILATADTASHAAGQDTRLAEQIADEYIENELIAEGVLPGAANRTAVEPLGEDGLRHLYTDASRKLKARKGRRDRQVQVHGDHNETHHRLVVFGETHYIHKVGELANQIAELRKIESEARDEAYENKHKVANRAAGKIGD